MLPACDIPGGLVDKTRMVVVSDRVAAIPTKPCVLNVAAKPIGSAIGLLLGIASLVLAPTTEPDIPMAKPSIGAAIHQAIGSFLLYLLINTLLSHSENKVRQLSKS